MEQCQQLRFSPLGGDSGVERQDIRARLHNLPRFFKRWCNKDVIQFFFAFRHNFINADDDQLLAERARCPDVLRPAAPHRLSAAQHGALDHFFHSFRAVQRSVLISLAGNDQLAQTGLYFGFHQTVKIPEK